MKRVRSFIWKALSFVGIFAVFLVASLYLMLLLITHGPSESARNLFTTTLLETGALKWVVGTVLDKNTVQKIVDSNSLVEMKSDVDDSLINIQAENTEENTTIVEPIEIKKINGSNYSATMMIVHDPSRVSVASTYPFSTNGVTLKALVQKFNAVGGVNGGLYSQDEGRGGYPLGVVVQNNEIVFNNPTDRKGYVLVGFDTSNILRILSIEGMNAEQVENTISENKIRDAVTFQEEASDSNNHFVKLIVNGEAREANGNGSGANPRTAIGQTADGSVLLLVTDGRGANGHLGATAADLISIMKDYGAVNAANIDGGS